MVRLDHRSVGQGSLLCVAHHHGLVDVLSFENDAHDLHRPAAADDDEDHAGHHGGHFHDLAYFQRPGGVYFDEQPGGHRSAVVAQPLPSGDRAGADKTGE